MGYAPSAAFSASASGANASRRDTTASEPTKRLVIRAFEAQSDIELKLSEGDIVIISHDPEAAQHNVHRWVYGTSESTNEKGWYPLSVTVPCEDSSAQEDQ